MERIHVFLDEFGNSNFDFSKSGVSSHFIIAAILVPESQVNDLSSELEKIRKKEFQTGEMKSKTIGNNHSRRVRILQQIVKLKFNVLLLVVDKKQIKENSGLSYKRSFYKFLYEIVYSHLHSNIAMLKLHNDGMGTNEFIKGFVEYANRKNQTPSLFEEFNIEFEDSKSNVIIQLADFIAGSVARNIDSTTDKDKCDIQYLEILSSHLFPILYFPRTLEDFISNTNFAADEDKDIAELCCRKARNYIALNRNSSDEIICQRKSILMYLLFRVFNNPYRDYICTKELISYLTRLGYNEYNKTSFRNKIIAGLRDEGVIIASSKTGYKIPTKLSEINDFLNHGKTIVIPMLRRLNTCAQTLTVGTNGSVDILQGDENRILRNVLVALNSQKTASIR